MEFPSIVSNRHLFSKLTEDTELLAILRSLRCVVAVLAETTGRSVPHYTDHTIRHMDALWSVAEQVLTPIEIDCLTPAEAFLLGCGFYLHDIGMAYAATEEGLQRLKASAPYKGYIASLPQSLRTHSQHQAQAIAIAVRQLHADAAKELAVHQIPGSAGRYLFEALSVREAWGSTCGDIASSHHWDLSRLESFFGTQSSSPLPGGRKGDLLYVCACLRLIDYAHINRERASSLDRAFRSPLNVESLVHWLAQEHIDGPLRDRDELVYRAANPIASVDAWWLYYEMISGLDSEIRSVKRMLEQRREEHKKIALNGVRGISSPEEAAKLIPTAGFLPIEVNLRAGSIDRLVELLAGETLYGPNPMAAVRELVQNARDAVLLKAEVATQEADRALLNLPITVSLNTTSNLATLEVVDYGIGMTRRVMTDYLIAIASNYWTSQFANDFPAVAERGFKSAGKFGIGFLSVFMLGEEVQVESNRTGGDRYRLSLRGVGRRGELRQVEAAGGSGTAIRIKLRAGALRKITPLEELVPVYAPTLPHGLVVSVDGKRTEFSVGWVKTLPSDRFQQWLDRAILTLDQRSHRAAELSMPMTLESYIALERHQHTHARRSAFVWPKGTPEFISGNTRLMASFQGISILCVRGLAVQTIRTPGFSGIIELDSMALEVSRNRTVTADISSVLDAARAAVVPQVIDNLNTMSGSGLLINKMAFFGRCVRAYGRNVLLGSRLPWVSQLTFPGNVELVDSATLLSRLTTARSAFLSFGTGPWTAMKYWEQAEPMQTELAVVLNDDDGPGPGYLTTKDSPKIGAIANLWAEYSNSSLFATLIDVFAQSWQVSPTDLIQQNGWTHEGSHLYGRFSRG
jgi:hypothetical protein